MRILMLNHFPLVGSGSGVYALNVAAGAVRAGHEVLAVVPDHEPVTGYDFPVETILCANGDNGTYELDFNFPCFTTHPRSTTTFYELTESQLAAYLDAWRRTVDEAVARFRPDVIHAHHVWVAGHVARRTGTPYVCTCHGTDLAGFEKGPRYRPMALDCAEGAGAVIAISRQVHVDAAATYGLDPDRVPLIWNGFDAGLFTVLPGVTKEQVLGDLGLETSDGPLVSFVGKFTDFKGIDVLLRAAAIYEHELPGVQTVLAGDGELWDDLHALRDELGLRGVRFVGHQSQGEVARLFNAADLAVVPSRMEAFGLVAVEALACGTPVVATDAGGLPDFVNADVGTLIPMDDPSALAAAVLRELHGDAKRIKGARAAGYALERFTWERAIDRILALYLEAAATR